MSHITNFYIICLHYHSEVLNRGSSDHLPIAKLDKIHLQSGMHFQRLVVMVSLLSLPEKIIVKSE